jgi:hypothetical protein
VYPAFDRSGTLAAFSSPIESDQSVAATSQPSDLKSQPSGLSPQVSVLKSPNLKSQPSGLLTSSLSPQVSSSLSPQVSENYAPGQDVPTTNCGVVRIVRAFGLRVHGPFSMRSISSFAASRPIL